MNHYEDNEANAVWHWAQFNKTLSEHLFHVPNGGKRFPKEAARFKRQGVRAGVHDFFLPVPRGDFHGLWIELKASQPNNAPYTEKQKEWEDKMLAQGYAAFCCLGFDETRLVFNWYLNLPMPIIKQNDRKSLDSSVLEFKRHNPVF